MQVPRLQNMYHLVGDVDSGGGCASVGPEDTENIFVISTLL